MTLERRIHDLEQAAAGQDGGQEHQQQYRALNSFGAAVEAEVLATLLDVGAIRIEGAV